MARYILSVFTRFFTAKPDYVVPVLIPCDVAQRVAWTEIANG